MQKMEVRKKGGEGVAYSAVECGICSRRWWVIAWAPRRVVAGDERRPSSVAWASWSLRLLPRTVRVLCSASFRDSANCECPLRTVYRHSVAPNLQDSQLCAYLIAGIYVGSFEDFSPIKVQRLDFCSFTNSRSRSLSLSLSLSRLLSYLDSLIIWILGLRLLSFLVPNLFVCL
jgi:hypothetical protein